MIKGGIGNLMKQAQAMQENMQKLQAKLAEMEIEGESGAGLVKVTMTYIQEKMSAATAGLPLPPGFKLPF